MSTGASISSAEQVLRRAVADLRSITDDDPSARRAMRALRLTIHTIEEVVLPAIGTGSGSEDAGWFETVDRVPAKEPSQPHVGR